MVEARASEPQGGVGDRVLQLPTFLIIGAMRSGTTAMSRYLRRHPDVYMSRPKEVHFFDTHHRKGVPWYAAHFAEAQPGRLVGEATPFYMAFPGTVDRMAATVPDARLIAILRNPIDRAYSHYWRYRSKGLETLPFSKAIEREESRMETPEDHRFAYARLGRYHEQLQYVCSRFPRDALLVLIFEEMVRNPIDAFASACRFIGARDDIVPSVIGQPANVYLSARKRRFLKRVKIPLLRGLVSRGTKPGTYPPMDRALRAELEQRFRVPNADLARWLGRDLSGWDPAP